MPMQDMKRASNNHSISMFNSPSYVNYGYAISFPHKLYIMYATMENCSDIGIPNDPC